MSLYTGQVSDVEKSKYSIMLKSILQFSKIKYGLVAEAIGYDVSYVSKWVHGVRLPAAKNIDDINCNIARHIAHILFEQNRAAAFSKEFMVVMSESEEELMQEIYGLLSEAYRVTIRKETFVGREGKNDPRVIVGQSACRKVLETVMRKNLENSIVATSVIITGDFFDLENNHFFDALAYLALGAYPCNIYIGLDMKRMEANKESGAGRLYHCLDMLMDYQFTMYQNEGSAYKNVIVIENAVAILYYVNEQGHIDLCVLIQSLEEVNYIYNRCKEYVLAKPILLLPKKTLGMDRFGYRDMFFTSNRYFYFLAHGFEFLLPDAVFDSLLRHARQGEYAPIDERWIRRVQIIWENLMDKAELHFMLPSNTIIQYLETGYIHLNDFSYKLSLEERRLHVEQILHVMKLNPHITLGVLLPKTETHQCGNFSNLSFYSNYATAFFKKDLRRIHKQTAPVYLINNADLLQYFHAFFEGQTHLPGYREYTYEELITLYSKYEFLLNNMFAESQKS